MNSWPIKNAGGIRLKAGATLAVLMAGLLSGCSGNSDHSGDPASSAAAATPVSGGTPAIGTSPSPGATAADLPVLGSRKTSHRGLPIQVDLNEVRVNGKTMTITFTARNLLPASSTGSWQIADFFSDGIYQKLADGTNELGLNADGVYVVDGPNAKRYLVARDPEGRCVCSADLSTVFVDPGQGVVLTAVLGAPPEQTTKVDVYVPHAGSFSGVAISR